MTMAAANDLLGHWTTSLGQHCDQQHWKRTHTYVYCLAVSLCFVGSLYVLVPSSIRKLDRDDPRQIERRTFAVCLVSALSVAAYPFLFCGPMDHTETNLSSTERMASVLDLLGLPVAFSIDSFRHHGWATLIVLSHTMMLYLGPLVAKAALLAVHSHHTRNEGWIQMWGVYCWEPFWHQEPWQRLRNYMVAPFTEELCFRACLVAPLLTSVSTTSERNNETLGLAGNDSTMTASALRLTPTQVAWIAPLWFGAAHVHHAYLQRVRFHQPLPQVLLVTTFQWTYTTLFGAYATHAFIRTGSLPAVVVCHSFCNYMGLPDLAVVAALPKPTMFLVAIVAYIIGIVWFAVSFSSWLPTPSVLVERIG